MLLYCHLEGNAIIILILHELAEIDHYVLICCELHPNVKRCLFLDVANHGVELEIFFCLRRLGHLETHWTLTFIVKFQLLAIDVAKKADLEIVGFFFDPYWHLHAFSLEMDKDRRRMQHVLDR